MVIWFLSKERVIWISFMLMNSLKALLIPVPEYDSLNSKLYFSSTEVWHPSTDSSYSTWEIENSSLATMKQVDIPSGLGNWNTEKVFFFFLKGLRKVASHTCICLNSAINLMSINIHWVNYWHDLDSWFISNWQVSSLEIFGNQVTFLVEKTRNTCLYSSLMNQTDS